MAELEKRVTGTAPALQQQHDMEDLPSLFGQLGDNVVTLLDAKLSLAKVEIKEEASAYAKISAMIGAGAIIAAVGFALVNVAIAFFVSKLFNFDQATNYALGFILTGVVYLVAGGALMLIMKNRLGARAAVPQRSAEELRKDKQWLKNEI